MTIVTTVGAMMDAIKQASDMDGQSVAHGGQCTPSPPSSRRDYA